MKAPRFAIPLVLFALAFIGALWALKQPRAAAPERATRSVPAQAPMLQVVESAPAAAPMAQESVTEQRVREDSEPESEAIPAYTGESPIDAAERLATLRSSLRVASADDDPDVAARAQEEYERLIDREDR